MTKPLMNIGETVRVKSMKRLVFKVISYKGNGDYTDTYTMKGFYNPSPRSRLKNKTLFSKVKIPINK